MLLNLHPSPKPPTKYKGANFDLVGQLNGLNNCTAINDFRYLYLNGTHHQKLVLVYNSKRGLMAYVGTCDVETGRISAEGGEKYSARSRVTRQRGYFKCSKVDGASIRRCSRIWDRLNLISSRSAR